MIFDFVSHENFSRFYDNFVILSMCATKLLYSFLWGCGLVKFVICCCLEYCKKIKKLARDMLYKKASTNPQQ